MKGWANINPCLPEISLRSVKDLKSEQAIDTAHVVFALEFDDPRLALLLGPLQERVPWFHEIVEGYTEPTGILDARKIYADNGAHAEIESKAFVERIEVWIAGLQHLALTVKAENERWSLEGAEHDGDTPVLLEMSDGLGTTAREILVGDGMAIKDGEGVLALRRHINVTTFFRRSGGNEIDVLPVNEGLEPIGYVFIKLAHHCSPRSKPVGINQASSRRHSSFLAVIIWVALRNSRGDNGLGHMRSVTAAFAWS